MKPGAKPYQSDGNESSENSIKSPLKLIRTYITHTDRTPREQRLFEVSIRELYLPIISFVLIVIGFLVAVTWPTDFLLFDYEIVFWASVWRTGALVFVVLMGIGIKYFRLVRRNVNFFFVLLGSVMLSITGYSLGQAAQLSGMSDIITPWFDISFLVPLLTTVLSMRIVSRIFSTTLMTVSYVLSYLFTFPYTEWADPYLLSSSITVLTSIVMCTFLGHVLYHLNRRDFFRERKLQKERQKSERLAARDQLTDLYNYRTFHKKFESIFDESKSSDSHLSIILLDLDHFKKINDKYGHLTGDSVLEQVGEILKQSIRDDDIPARYGGEEFGVLLPDTQGDVARQIAARLRENLRNTTFEKDGDTFQVTCSIGVAQRNNNMIETEDLLREADDALYQAKQAGRDQVQSARDI